MIRFDQVSKVFRGQTTPALSNITCEILRGEFVFLVGPSGSGKSSMLRLILLEDQPSSGQIHVLGQDLRAISNSKIPYYRRDIGMIFQDFRLLPNKTVGENVAYALQVLGKSRGFIGEAVPDVLEMVGLEDKAKRFPHELSGGEQQRVAIARAVVNKPPILLADEPTGNLDPDTSRDIMRVLKRINANGTTVVMATHDVTIVDEEKRRVIELEGGVIIRDETDGVYKTEFVDVTPDESSSAKEGTSRRGRRRAKPIAEVLAERVSAEDAIVLPADDDAATSPAALEQGSASTENRSDDDKEQAGER